MKSRFCTPIFKNVYSLFTLTGSLKTPSLNSHRRTKNQSSLARKKLPLTYMQKNGVLVRCFGEWFTVCLQKLPLKIKMRLSAQSKSDLGCFDPDLIDIYWFAFTKWSWPLGPQPNHTKVVWAPKAHPKFRSFYGVGIWCPPHFQVLYRMGTWCPPYFYVNYRVGLGGPPYKFSSSPNGWRKDSAISCTPSRKP